MRKTAFLPILVFVFLITKQIQSQTYTYIADAPNDTICKVDIDSKSFITVPDRIINDSPVSNAGSNLWIDEINSIKKIYFGHRASGNTNKTKRTNTYSSTVENATTSKETQEPTGYSVTIDQDPIDASNEVTVSFTFSGAEVGATYNYTFSSSGAAATVTSTGTIVTATDQITGIDLSCIADGTITLSVTLTDTGGNTGAVATDTSTKVNSAPTFTSSPVTSIDEGDLYTYNITTTDSDGESGVIIAPTLPSWLTLTPNDYTVSTFAGTVGVIGSTDGTGTAASFNTSAGLAVDASGNIYVAESGSHLIRKISPAGVVTTLAGTVGVSGSTNGTGTAASFNNPRGVAVDALGNVYVTDRGNHLIRKISPTGVVTTFAGTVGGAGFNDGTGTEARFKEPTGIDIDTSDNLYISTTNGIIRKITPMGVVTTFAGSVTIGPTGTQLAGPFRNVFDITVDNLGNVYVAEFFNRIIKKVTPAGVITTFAGHQGAVDGITNGTGTEASFAFLFGIESDAANNIYVTQASSNPLAHLIRKITPAGVVSTFAGGVAGYNDGSANVASFRLPAGITVDASGTFYVGDRINQLIRKITTNNAVLSGDSTSQLGDHPVVIEVSDGNGGTAQQSFTITVNDITDPVISCPADVIVEFGDPTTPSDLGTATATDNSGANPTITFADVITSGVGNNSTIARTWTATDASSNSSSCVQTITIQDTTAPTGYSITIDQDPIDATNATAVSFTFADAEVGSTYNYTYSTSGGSGTVTGTGTISTTTDQITGIDLSGIADGTITLSVTLTDTNSNTGAVVTDTSTKNTVVNITVDDPMVIEGDSGTATLQYTVSLETAALETITVDVATSDGTASSSSDYTALTTTTHTFMVGETTQTVDITIAGDTTVEADETLNLDLSNATGPGMITDAIGVGTITNDDSASITIADISGNEDDGDITVTATLDNAVQGGFTVDINTSDGTATITDSDYTSITSQTLTFTGTAGETQTFTVSPTTDTKVEADETLTVSQNNLASTTLGVSITITDGATVTITNDDSTLVTIADISGNEDDGGITVTATLDNAVQGGFTVDVNTSDGTATISDSDYTSVTNHTLTFTGTAGETQTFTVSPTTDTKVEANETLTVSQNNLTATTLGSSITITDGATVTIINDDITTVTIENITMVEANGTANLTATLSNPIEGGFFIHATTTDGTAVATSDYTAFNDDVVTDFSGVAGETQTIIIPIADDSIGEEVENFTIALSSVSGTSLGANINIADTATVTILDDDVPEVTIVSVPADELYGIGDYLDFTVTFSNSVSITGNPSIAITIGTTTVQAVLNETVNDALTVDFRYTIVEGDLDIDGIEVGTVINLNGGTIVGSSGIDAILPLNNVGNTSNVDVDGIKPTIVITSDAMDPTNVPFTVTFTFSEDVTDFEMTDIAIENGTASNFDPTSGNVYTALITPQVDGMVTVDVEAGVAIDAASNPNDARSTYSVVYDGTNPTVSITSTAPNPTNLPFIIDIVFSEDVIGFDMSDLITQNGILSDFVTVVSGSVYSVLITPQADGAVTIIIPEGAAQDAATNPNIADQLTLVYDTTEPFTPIITHISDYTCIGNINMTGDNTLKISGISEEESIIEVFQDGAYIGTTTTLNSGFFTFDHTGTTLADGSYSFTITATDATGNLSALSDALTITINSVDTDGDGLPDFCDDDDDGNGVDDVDEDCDGDGIIDSLDTDNNSCSTNIEMRNNYGISPNDDGINDVWFIENITAFPNNTVQVFNRSGKRVYKKKRYQNDWGGISNQTSNNGLNKPLPVGPYLFIIDLGDGSPLAKGWLYINY